MFSFRDEDALIYFQNVRRLNPESPVLRFAINWARLMEKELKNAHEISDPFEKACAYRDKVFKNMKVLRSYGDALERVVGKTYWPFATYEDLLFNI